VYNFTAQIKYISLSLYIHIYVYIYTYIYIYVCTSVYIYIYIHIYIYRYIYETMHSSLYLHIHIYIYIYIYIHKYFVKLYPSICDEVTCIVIHLGKWRYHFHSAWGNGISMEMMPQTLMPHLIYEGKYINVIQWNTSQKHTAVHMYIYRDIYMYIYYIYIHKYMYI